MWAITYLTIEPIAIILLFCHYQMIVFMAISPQPPTVYVSPSPLQLIWQSRQGVPGIEADRVAGLLGVSDKEMARLLNQSVATFHRQTKSTLLDAATSERLLLLERLANYGKVVFQDNSDSSSSKFSRWLRRPLRLLGDQAPLDLLDSLTGIQLVEDMLGRIEYGVFS